MALNWRTHVYTANGIKLREYGKVLLPSLASRKVELGCYHFGDAATSW
jgi:hypothetical protein